MKPNITAILNIIVYTSFISHLLPLVAFLLFKLKTKEKPLRVIFFYILYSILNESVGFYLQTIRSEQSFILYSIFTVLEFSFFSLFYYYILPTAKAKKAIFPLWLFFIIFFFIDFFFINKMTGFDSVAIGIESLFIIFMCIYYLITQIKGVTNLQVYSTSNFWIIITFLIYLSGTFFLYILTATMINDKAFRIQYVYINSFFNILKNVLLSIAMLMKPGQVKPEIKKNYEWNDYNHVN